MRRIILASQSPRRKELLTAMGLVFDTMPSNFEERLDETKPAAILAQGLALGKAMVVARQHPDAIVIGSDTIGVLDGTQLEKPKDCADAKRMHRAMAGRGHLVVTGVVVVCLEKHLTLCGAAETLVVCKPYNEILDDIYLDTGDYADKAGGYGIQSGGHVLIDHIEGEYDTVIGLPTKLLAELLHEAGIADCHPVTLPMPVPVWPRLEQ